MTRCVIPVPLILPLKMSLATNDGTGALPWPRDRLVAFGEHADVDGSSPPGCRRVGAAVVVAVPDAARPWGDTGAGQRWVNRSAVY